MNKPIYLVASYDVIISGLIILCVIAIFLQAQQILQGKAKGNLIKVTALVLVLIYFGGYIYITFLCRSPSDIPQARLIPFWSYREAFQMIPFKIRNKIVAKEIVLNILLTVPMGLFLPIIFYRSRHFYSLSIIVALVTTILTEIFQYYTCMGVCETDDLINNMLGCIIGIAVFSIGTKLVQKKAFKTRQ